MVAEPVKAIMVVNPPPFRFLLISYPVIAGITAVLEAGAESQSTLTAESEVTVGVGVVGGAVRVNVVTVAEFADTGLVPTELIAKT